MMIHKHIGATELPRFKSEKTRNIQRKKKKKRPKHSEPKSPPKTLCPKGSPIDP